MPPGYRGRKANRPGHLPQNPSRLLDAAGDGCYRLARRTSVSRHPEPASVSPARAGRALIATLAAAAVGIGLSLACLLAYLPGILRKGLPLQFGVGCVMAAIIYLVGRFISGAVARERGTPPAHPASRGARPRRAVRFILVTVMAVAAEVIVIQGVGRGGRGSVFFDLIYYMIFFFGALLLARDFEADFIPLLFGLVVVPVAALIEFLSFIRSPEVVSRFGPDRVLIALRTVVARVDMLPLVMAIAWTAWRVSRSNRLPVPPPRRG
jgi:hypothetical protein